MPKLIIDGQEITVPEGYTVLQAAHLLNKEVPVFCYHSRLEIAGNCRMCLVEMEKSPKPIASCAMPALEGMVIHTNSEKVKKARQGVLEFLLINHPLDCPICDQAGECDLQDISVAYGRDTSRFDETKRSVPEKNMGPLIRTFMNRCIHCTRCIRFADRVAGIPELGSVSRGEDMEITTYLDAAIHSELAGNLVDVCPVGALTARPYAHETRPWELSSTPSIDVLDGVGSNIVIQSDGLRVKRILPRLHEGINEEWLSDKSRYACDALTLQRLDRPYIRHKGKLVESTWQEALKSVANHLKKTDPSKTAALIGDLVECESILALKDLMASLKVQNLDCSLEGIDFRGLQRVHYLFNTTIEGIEKADFCLILGANVRRDASLIHTRLRKRFLQGEFPIVYLGGSLEATRDFTFAYENLGDDPQTLEGLLAGTHPISKRLRKAKFPMIIVGYDALRRPDGPILLIKAAALAETYPSFIQESWNGFNVLHPSASRVGALDLCFYPGPQGKRFSEIMKQGMAGDLDFLYLLGVDSIDLSSFKKTFVVYQGHHGDRGAEQADVVLPGAAYTEKNGSYLNTEGRLQRTYLAVQPPGQAKQDFEIIRALSDYVGSPLPYDTLEGLRARLAKVHPIFCTEDKVLPEPWVSLPLKGSIKKERFAPSPFHFYMTDIISRHSPTMARCTQELCNLAALPKGHKRHGS